MVGFFVMVVPRVAPAASSPALEALLLGYTGAILGALVSGIFDHYWFNMTYPHMTVLFWLYVGMATAVILIAGSAKDSSASSSEVIRRRPQSLDKQYHIQYYRAVGNVKVAKVAGQDSQQSQGSRS